MIKAPACWGADVSVDICQLLLLFSIISPWLNKANVMLYRVWQFVNERTLISIYHAIFDSHLNYASIVWGQANCSINMVFIIQNKALKTIHLKGEFDHISSLFSESNTVKLPDKISIENWLFVNKSLNRQLPEIFHNWFVFSWHT